MAIAFRTWILLVLFALSGEGLVVGLMAQSTKAPGSIQPSPAQAAAMESLIQSGLPFAHIAPPPPCDSLESPSLKPAAMAWFKQVRDMPQDPSLNHLQRENNRYRLTYRSSYQWRDEMCFADRRSHCLAVERDPGFIRFGRALTTDSESVQPVPGFQGQIRYCASYDEGRYLICQDWDHYIGNSCWGTEITEGYERVQSGLSPLRTR